jgi:hypothetical protein
MGQGQASRCVCSCFFRLSDLARSVSPDREVADHARMPVTYKLREGPLSYTWGPYEHNQALHSSIALVLDI